MRKFLRELSPRVCRAGVLLAPAVVAALLSASLSAQDVDVLAEQDPPACEDRCIDYARHFAQRCQEAGFDEDACEARAANLLEHCLSGCESDAPPPCPQRCRRAANDLLEKCVEDGGSRRRCQLQAADFFTDCVTDNCEPPTCDDRCVDHGVRAFRHCIDNGNEPAVCRERVGNQVEACLERCENGPPSRCLDRCEEGARARVARCIEAGGDPDRCARVGRHFFRRCRYFCESIHPRCRQRCAAFAREVHEECTEANGEDSGECVGLAEEALQACVEGCDPPPPDVPCAERCEAFSGHLAELCVELGGDPEACNQRARNFQETCLERCDGPDRPCGSRCVHRARRLFSRCVDEGGRPIVCRLRVFHWLKECLSECPPVRCRVGCAKRSRRLYAACLEHVEERVRLCVEDGGDPQECERKAKRHCRRRINGFLANCLKGCRGDEPAPCYERCTAGAELVHEECKGAGGEDDECDGAVAEFLDHCRRRCDDPKPPHPCRVQCDRVGELVRFGCESAGPDDEGNVPDCDAEVAAFLEECQAHKAELCSDENMAHDLAPFDFRRGDVNEDGEHDIGDALAILEELFFGNTQDRCKDAMDTNDDGEHDVADAVRLLYRLFLGADPLAEPADEPGQDPTEDDELCE